MDAERAATDVDAAFQAVGDPERAPYMKAYLKSDLEFRGVETAGIRGQVTHFLGAHPSLTREDLVALVRECWARPVYEVRSFACGVLGRGTELLAQDDIGLFEDLLRRSHTWAYVDSLAGHVGALVEAYPELDSVLDRWAKDGDFWVRRAAMLALLPALRRGEGDLDRFLRYADAMLDETEFFIRKAIGWVLREVGKKRPEAVYEFLAPRIDRVSGVTIREAVKYLPSARKDELMRAYRERSGAKRPTRRRGPGRGRRRDGEAGGKEEGALPQGRAP